MRSYFYIIILFVLCVNVGFAQKEKFQINGDARAYLFSNELDIDKSIDTVTTKKANYGHTLLDLGFSLFPNTNTEIISVFRIRNELGGFWGGGTSFNVRQLTLKGVAGDVVRYELGDIDLKLTPYTLFNNIEEGVVNESDVFAIKRDVVYYDMFYNANNTWRMQGAKMDFGLNFSKIIKTIDFKGYITRQRPTDGILVPERLYGGGIINIVQSKNFQIGFNSISLFDLTKTIQDSIRFSNSVHTTNFNYLKEINSNVTLGLKGEAGISNSTYENYNDVFVPEKNDDWFYDAALTTNFKKQNITVNLGFKDVGADFTSPGAQTKRINFSRTPSLYQQFTNNFSPRTLSYNDYINGNAESTFKITDQLMAYNVAYSNTNPYGAATPNRMGMYVEATRNDSTKFRESFLQASMLSESRGSGTNNKKNFLIVRAGTDVYINDFFKWKKDLKIDFGVQFENTTRNGEEYEKVNLSSTFIDAGLTIEFVEKLNFLAGLKFWQASGNEFINQRDRYNTIIDFTPTQINFSEYTYAVGLKYDFSKKNMLAAQYEMYSVKHQNNLGTNYGINTFNILYRLTF
jgi:hypothetical protein